MIYSHSMVNPIIQGESVDTLIEVANCLDYLSSTFSSIAIDDAPPQAHLGLSVLMECVLYAVRHEVERLKEYPTPNLPTQTQ